MKLNKTLFALALLSTLGLSACSKNKKPDELKLIDANYFSMRPQGTQDYYGLLKLKSEPLLRNAKTENGKLVIDEELKKAILSEQEELIKKLKSISPEIRVVAKYRMVLNAISIVAPKEFASKIDQISSVEKIQEQSFFNRPEPILGKRIELSGDDTGSNQTSLSKKNSATFIGANAAYEKGIKGQGLKIGVIDTGIDYIHSMLGGPGSKEIYDGIDSTTNNVFFPNAKVVGGVDIVGDNYNSRNEDLKYTVPVRDANPIDLSGHGTHVAGTIAGIGDGVNTYDGVAPDASLYAIKVFGKEGSTSSLAVISALEYAADPTEQVNPSKRLDVINLSLGGGYGKPNILYTEAIRNLTNAGTVVVASAGNSGDNPYIVGAPSTSDEAISVAASIDDMAQNVEFSAVSFNLNGQEKTLEAIEGPISKPVGSVKLKEELVYIGNGKDAIDPNLKEKVRGKIALMDRGAISFVQKLQVAESFGAVGVVMLNNQPGNPFAMGGDGKFEFPAVMLSKEIGLEIKNALKTQSVVFDFNPGKKIVKNELVDTITDFSSRGPRSIDSLIKPEIAGPGQNIISAEYGSGNKGVQFSGTSMSGPHLAGVMGLLKQAFPNLSVKELKAIALNNTKIMSVKEKGLIPVALQGAGRVQISEALNAKVVAMPATLSLGEVLVNKKKVQTLKVVLTNTSSNDLVFDTKIVSDKKVEVKLPAKIEVKANSSKSVDLSFILQIQSKEKTQELDGFVVLTSKEQTINLPFLAMVNSISNIKVEEIKDLAESEEDRSLSDLNVKITNVGENQGVILPFNLIGIDDRKASNPELEDLSFNKLCDLESAGYRIVKNGQTEYLEFGFKFYDTLTMWQPCDVSVQFDQNNDGVTDQELVGIIGEYISGISSKEPQSVLLDAKLARDLRAKYESKLGTAEQIEEDYSEAIQSVLPFKFYEHSTISVLRVELKKLKLDNLESIKVKLAAMNLDGDKDVDDFLGTHETTWDLLNLSKDAQPFINLENEISLDGKEVKELIFNRGQSNGKMLLLLPHNAPIFKATLKDSQSIIF